MQIIEECTNFKLYLDLVLIQFYLISSSQYYFFFLVSSIYIAE